MTYLTNIPDSEGSAESATTGAKKVFQCLADDNAVNYLTFTSTATGEGVIIGADGTDSDIDILLEPKGGGLTAVVGVSAVANSDGDANHAVYTAIVETTDETVTQLAGIPVAVDTAYSVEVDVVARESDGSNRAQYKLAGLFYRNTAGDVTQQGSTASISTIESDTDWDADLVADTENQQIDLNVTGVAATTINWVATIKYTALG